MKILDLGLAKLHPGEAKATGTMTSEGVAMGTLGYMSPEQLAGRNVDQRTDISAVGVILIEVLTGQPPFQIDSHPAQSHPYASSFSWRRDAPHQWCALYDLLEQCVAADPPDRIPSAAALRDRLILPYCVHRRRSNQISRSPEIFQSVSGQRLVAASNGIRQ